MEFFVDAIDNRLQVATMRAYRGMIGAIDWTEAAQEAIDEYGMDPEELEEALGSAIVAAVESHVN